MVERFAPHLALPRHRHAAGYAAVVLAGSYEECGSRGQLIAEPGYIILHSRFEAHLNRFRARGADVFDIPLDGDQPPCTLGTVADPDALIRLAEKDPRDARQLLRQTLQPLAPKPASDWPSLLAASIMANPNLSLGHWARQHQLARETLSRGFSRVFRVSPAQFRLEARTHKALALIADNPASLATVAADAGFSDQAHMNRTLRALTGQTPAKLAQSGAAPA